MSPLYTAEERQVIGSCRETLRMSREQPNEFALFSHAMSARETMRNLGMRAALRAWRRKCKDILCDLRIANNALAAAESERAAAHRVGLLDAAEIALARHDALELPTKDGDDCVRQDECLQLEAAIRRASGASHD